MWEGAPPTSVSVAEAQAVGWGPHGGGQGLPQSSGCPVLPAPARQAALLSPLRMTERGWSGGARTTSEGAWGQLGEEAQVAGLATGQATLGPVGACPQLRRDRWASRRTGSSLLFPLGLSGPSLSFGQSPSLSSSFFPGPVQAFAPSCWLGAGAAPLSPAAPGVSAPRAALPAEPAPPGHRHRFACWAFWLLLSL